MKLTSSKCFGKTLKDKTDSEYRRLRDNFDYFIEQPLTLGMFVPCDEEGIILSECTYLYDVYKNLSNDEKRDYKLRCENYQQAKERILFKGFYSTDENTVSNGEIEIIFGNLITLMIHRNHGSEGITKEKMFIEDLVDYNLTITDGF